MMEKWEETASEIENVRVVVRIRPLTKKEVEQNCQNIISVDQNENIIILTKAKVAKLPAKAFKFDHIFPDDSTQMDLYQRVALPIVEKVFHGYNGTIFAYGQTGSGKTYTMTGYPHAELKGVIPNTFTHIFSQISQASGEKFFVVTATYLEIYNEEVRDLLSAIPNEKLELRERADVGVYVKGLSGFTVDSIESISELMHVGNANRKTRSTLMNDLSSRSHAVFTITVEAKDRKDNKTTVAKLNLVDLAGSERLNRTHATGDGLKEASNINQSLFVLSNVISALVEEKSTHIPYRNSKLTRLLQDSLGGNSKTAMIATISPCAVDYEETLCTLRYASRAKLIKNRVRLNLQMNKGMIEEFEQQISELQCRLATISVKAEQAVKQQSVRRSKSQEEGASERQQQQLLNIERVKGDLHNKIAAIQNKILVGGQNLFDKAQEQQFLLETSFEEIKNLDRSHQELEDLLEEKEIERFDLEEQYTSLQEENSMLDKKIEKLQVILQRTRAQLNDDQQDHQQELVLLADNNQSLQRQLRLLDMVIKTFIPTQQLKKVESNISWNEETCDFQVNGIAHAGNNRKKPQRRFKRHIPRADIMGILLHERKTITPIKRLTPIQPAMKDTYGQYVSPHEINTDESD